MTHPDPLAIAPSPSRRPVSWRVPPHAVDCHHHIYDPRFPMAAGAPPLVATVAQYRDLQMQLGVARSVIVQPSAYGTDNRCLLDALASFGDAARGVAVVAPDVADSELSALDVAGVRGIRFNLKKSHGTAADALSSLARRVAERGWHVQINATPAQFIALASVLETLACPLVIDHMGQTRQPLGLDDPVVDLQLKLLARGNTWVKLSGAYINSRSGAPGYDDVVPVAQALVRARPDRLVWGSDWPHPTAHDHLPDDVNLLDLLAVWAPDTATRHAIMTTNAERLYGFGQR